MRGRNRSKGPNPLTRSYESNGPDVKIRGTAQHIADKYAQLARDAQASGDPVMAENYFQHGEHYYRIIATANEQYRQQYGGTYGRQNFDDEGDDGDEGDAPPNGYAAQSEARGGFAAYGPGDDYGDPAQQPQPYGEPDGRPARFDRQDRGERQDRDRPERRERFQSRQDRPQRQDRQQDRAERPDRNDRADRADRQDYAPRGEPPRQDVYRDPPRGDAPRSDAPREGRRERRREDPRPEVAAEEPVGLPAFLTTPARAPAPVEEPPPPPPAEPEATAEEAPAARPRRRRRTRYEGAAPEGVEESGTDLFPKAAGES
ncbi:MAG: DUF4167 domain-containing protein [Methylobacterium frigidaeris]